MVVAQVFFFVGSASTDSTTVDTVTDTTHNVILTEHGFEPPLLQIELGDTVTFQTRLDKDFWPASDLHPSHSIYAEFDPKEAISSDDTWSFIFDAPGKWRYHDHLSLDRGVIIVGSGDELCDDDLRCWNELVVRALEDDGVDAALSVAEGLYAENPHFGAWCHLSLHTIGNFLYQEHTKGTPITWEKNYFNCNAGLMHGFMNALYSKEGDTQDAFTICDGVRSSFEGSLGEHLYQQCYHGIGDSFFDFAESEKDISSILATAIGRCDALPRDKSAHEGCVTGVYAALSGFLHPDIMTIREHPYALCTNAPHEHRMICYWNIDRFVLKLAQYDFETAFLYTSRIEHPEGRAHAQRALLGRLGAGYTSISRGEIYDMCEHVSSSLSESECIQAIISGYMGAGVPNQEYIAAIHFCEEPRMSTATRSSCIHTVRQAAQIKYTDKVQQEFCTYLSNTTFGVDCDTPLL